MKPSSFPSAITHLAALTALLCAGCAMRPPTVGEPGPTLPEAEAERVYTQLLNRYSGRAEVYARFDTRAFFATTFQSPTFREARARRLSAFRSETLTELESRLDQERREDAESHEFFLGAHVNAPQFDDLDRKGTVWRIALVTPAGSVLPLGVERIGRANLPMRALYPYMDTFWTAYRVRFPREVAGQPVIPPGTEQVTLQIASPLGQAEMAVSAP
ncbi:MAG: hypothetical protein L0Y66_10065 [Myxococcaceae bacterium]|nr:hypothetical protein [Myxococcaceae bacterium]MCI0672705.1 hypothetical protein [Myxococcaceae bacterium]